ncbi:MAG TPA: sialidase family protein [Aggregatilineales bacterium]|nr:sialidase family protein [Aggregatilineales bacterium]
MGQLLKSQIISVAAMLAILVLLLGAAPALPESAFTWSLPQRVPGYADTTSPPILIADQNRTVHAFAYQQVGTAGKEIAIVYSQWTLGQGWTNPVDIILSPQKHEAGLLGAFLDQGGIVHLVFFGGDNTGASIYYVRAPLASAASAAAWSEPVLVGDKALNPESGSIAGDDKGNLVIVFNGTETGHGFYAAYSSDSGSSWTQPAAMFLADSDDLFPYNLQVYSSATGWLHAVWSTYSTEGQGRGTYYARLKLGQEQWSQPIELARTDSGYGTQEPAIVENRGQLIAMYYFPPKIFLRTSSDNGVTWTDPIAPFIHVGNNGAGSFAVDSSDNLHLFWGQRITGNPDIHGMWHSIWQSGHWSEPEAIVSGPLVSDHTGDKAFDPTAAQAIVSQGNVMLVTWRSDFGLKGNGVWYSYSILQTPELPLATVAPQANPNITAAPTVGSAKVVPTGSSETTSVATKSAPLSPQNFVTDLNNPISELLVGIVPVVVLILAIIAFIWYRSNRT